MTIFLVHRVKNFRKLRILSIRRKTRKPDIELVTDTIRADMFEISVANSEFYVFELKRIENAQICNSSISREILRNFMPNTVCYLLVYNS